MFKPVQIRNSCLILLSLPIHKVSLPGCAGKSAPEQTSRVRNRSERRRFGSRRGTIRQTRHPPPTQNGGCHGENERATRSVSAREILSTLEDRSSVLQFSWSTGAGGLVHDSVPGFNPVQVSSRLVSTLKPGTDWTFSHVRQYLELHRKCIPEELELKRGLETPVKLLSVSTAIQLICALRRAVRAARADDASSILVLVGDCQGPVCAGSIEACTSACAL